jgi:hypothetical protein
VIDFLDELGHSEHFILKRCNLGFFYFFSNPSLRIETLSFLIQKNSFWDAVFYFRIFYELHPDMKHFVPWAMSTMVL